MKLYQMVLSLLVLGTVSTVIQAEELTGTLKKINDNNLVIVGHREASMPFSYYGYNQQVVGYAQDYSNLIVEAIRQKLNKPDLRVKLLPITSQTRIPLLTNGSFDFECGSTTNNKARQIQAAFSNTFFIVGTRLLVRKDSGIKDISDLKGRNVVSTAGTTSELRLQQLNDSDKLGMKIISTKDHSGAFQTLESGRAVAFMMDDALLAGERAKAKKPDEWIIVGRPQSYEAYGCMLRKDDKQFKSLMDDAIASAQRSGKAKKSYDLWFTQPIQPNGMNLNFPMSDEMKALFKEPNDRAMD